MRRLCEDTENHTFSIKNTIFSKTGARDRGEERRERERENAPSFGHTVMASINNNHARGVGRKPNKTKGGPRRVKPRKRNHDENRNRPRTRDSRSRNIKRACRHASRCTRAAKRTAASRTTRLCARPVQVFRRGWGVGRRSQEAARVFREHSVSAFIRILRGKSSC